MCNGNNAHSTPFNPFSPQLRCREDHLLCFTRDRRRFKELSDLRNPTASELCRQNRSPGPTWNICAIRGSPARTDTQVPTKTHRHTCAHVPTDTPGQTDRLPHRDTDTQREDSQRYTRRQAPRHTGTQTPVVFGEDSLMPWLPAPLEQILGNLLFAVSWLVPCLISSKNTKNQASWRGRTSLPSLLAFLRGWEIQAAGGRQGQWDPRAL